MANGRLERSFEDLREMESVQVDIDHEKEEMVLRPDPDEERLTEVRGVLKEADDMLEEYRGQVADFEGALDIERQDPVDKLRAETGVREIPTLPLRLVLVARAHPWLLAVVFTKRYKQVPSQMELACLVWLGSRIGQQRSARRPRVGGDDWRRIAGRGCRPGVRRRVPH